MATLALFTVPMLLALLLTVGRRERGRHAGAGGGRHSRRHARPPGRRLAGAP
ncbi:hypothetical protein [Streptomyces sp. NPDC101132]|uniref:hypothetical protein n=1 Tax=Streptomyces sp. NPDC101132 TaxID=3366110 RepID=UPI0038260F2D